MPQKQLERLTSVINLADIDLEPGPFCMSFHFDLKPLELSIQKFGILNAPYLLKDSDNRFSIVAGYRRILTVRELGWKNLVCHILPENFSPLQALLMNLDENLLHRELNLIEKAMTLKRLIPYLPKAEIVEKYMPVLGMSANPQILKKVLDLELLDGKIKIPVASGCLAPKVASYMVDLSNKDQTSLCELFTSFKLSFNQQWKLLEWISEIAAREGSDSARVVEELNAYLILNCSGMNNPQKIKAATRFLKNRRFPRLSEAERLFKKEISRLHLPSGAMIIPPPFFEDIHYRLEITFIEGKELLEKLHILSELEDLKKVSEFWREYNP